MPREPIPTYCFALVVVRPGDRFLVGPDRLIYGGGFGAAATGDAYRAYRQKVRSYLADLPAGDQAKVLGGTAARLFGCVKA
jgi:predicted TIM-barrel fold metal-dependent hydrolase